MIFSVAHAGTINPPPPDRGHCDVWGLDGFQLSSVPGADTAEQVDAVGVLITPSGVKTWVARMEVRLAAGKPKTLVVEHVGDQLAANLTQTQFQLRLLDATDRAVTLADDNSWEVEARYCPSTALVLP